MGQGKRWLIAGGILLVLAGIGLALGLFISPSTIAATNATIVLSSTAGAADWQGDTLGEFVEAGEHGGKPFYRQRDTEGAEELFLYSEGGEWWVSDILGGSWAWLKNSQNTTTTPSTQWEYWDGEKWNDNDTSLTLEFTTLSPCKLVRVAGEGDVVEEHGSGVGQDTGQLGDYRLEEGRWSEGRPIFKKVNGETRFLIVAEGYIVWSITDNTTATEAWITSGRGTNSPSSPEAGPSFSEGVTRWMYTSTGVQEDGSEWVEGDRW